jgi:hypothetical protein
VRISLIIVPWPVFNLPDGFGEFGINVGAVLGLQD